MVLIILLFLTGMALMVLFGIRALQRFRLIKEIPTSISVDVEEGMMEIKGTAEPIPGIRYFSPFGHVPCVAYSAIVEERVSSGKRSRWVRRFSESKGDRFLVRDRSGLTRVLMKDADLHMADTFNAVTSGLKGVDPNSGRVLRGLGLPFKGPLGILNRTYRIRERSLPIDHEIYVLGTATEMDMESALKDEALVNPYTIHKDGVLIVSAKGEEEIASHYMVKGLALIAGGVILGGIGLLIAYTLFINVF